MSVKILISYTEEQELQNIITHLAPIAQHIKRRKNTKGQYKIADITVKE